MGLYAMRGAPPRNDSLITRKSDNKIAKNCRKHTVRGHQLQKLVRIEASVLHLPLQDGQGLLRVGAAVAAPGQGPTSSSLQKRDQSDEIDIELILAEWSNADSDAACQRRGPRPP